MKPAVVSVLTLALALFIFVPHIQAAPLETIAEGDFSYAVTDEDVSVTDYTGNEEDIVIPDLLDGSPVTAVADNAFSARDGIRTIDLPDSIRHIRERAFTGCKGLTSILLPPKLESIGPWAFVGCDSLQSISIPSGVTDIGDGALSACKALQAILVSEDNAVFASLDGVLYNKRDHALLAYPTGKEGTGYEVPDGTETIGVRAFADCDNLEQVTLPESLLALGASAFYGCDNLVRADLPDGLKTIGAAAFYWCMKLETCRIPVGVEVILPYAFSNCHAIKAFEVDEANTRFSTPSGMLYDEENAQVIAWPPASDDTEVMLPDETKAIGHAAFMNCTTVETITLPEGLQTIGQDAFRNCEAVKTVYVPPTVTDIGKTAFAVWDAAITLQVAADSAAHAYALEYDLPFELVPAP